MYPRQKPEDSNMAGRRRASLQPVNISTATNSTTFPSLPHGTRIPLRSKDRDYSPRCTRIKSSWRTTILNGEGGQVEQEPFRVAMRTSNTVVDLRGYQRGKRKNIEPSGKQFPQRYLYLSEFFANRDSTPLARLRVLYIYEHYRRYDDCIWDRNDEQAVQVSSPSSQRQTQGSLQVFAHAIQRGG